MERLGVSARGPEALAPLGIGAATIAATVRELLGGRIVWWRSCAGDSSCPSSWLWR